MCVKVINFSLCISPFSLSNNITFNITLHSHQRTWTFKTIVIIRRNVRAMSEDMNQLCWRIIADKGWFTVDNWIDIVGALLRLLLDLSSIYIINNGSNYIYHMVDTIGHMHSSYRILMCLFHIIYMEEQYRCCAMWNELFSSCTLSDTSSTQSINHQFIEFIKLLSTVSVCP